MADNIFEEKKDEQETQEAKGPEEEKIKLGDKEYTQEELSQLVGLGEFAKEVETKQNRKLDKIYPDYVKATQRLSELEKELEETKATKVPQGEGTELTPEQIKEQALI